MSFNGVKVFAATLFKDRAVLGETVTAWLSSHSHVRIADFVVTQSSDSDYHMLAITLFYQE
jgi:hypothetical protein